MQEFSSISVSSYEAASLADRLGEASGDGWEVLAIVPAGSDVVAYLSRPAGSGSSHGTDGSDEHAAPPAVTTPEAAAALAADAAAADTGAVEPAGWAAAPAPATDAATANTEAAATETATADAPAAAPAPPQPAPIPEPEPEPEPVQQAAADSAPAGWYADPAGRFELRYWDGSQWTEHVSRAGQQYTDPPVA